jgi:hypothetical protein
MVHKARTFAIALVALIGLGAGTAHAEGWSRGYGSYGSSRSYGNSYRGGYGHQGSHQQAYRGGYWGRGSQNYSRGYGGGRGWGGGHWHRW